MNKVEHEIKHRLESQGMQVLKNGWPDFLCLCPDGRVIAVEAKSKSDKLRENQKRCISWLAKAGLQIRVLTLKNGKVDWSSEFSWDNFGAQLYTTLVWNSRHLWEEHKAEFDGLGVS